MKTKYSKRFLKEARNLRKKFRQIDADLWNFVNLLEKGNFIGASKIQGLSGFNIYKARVRNSSNDSGKSGGFRIIYYLECDEKTFYLLTIYSKTQKSDISHREILEILKTENLV